MFTGIIKGTGHVQQRDHSQAGFTRFALSHNLERELELGDSVAVNGCCLTVCKKEPSLLFFELSQQTLETTSLNHLQTGSLVNLEPAITANEMLSGHIVSGHVDCTGKVSKINASPGEWRLGVSLDAEHRKYLITKGSICLDGISLTIADLNEAKPCVEVVCSIIPETLKRTHLQNISEGDSINIEFDIVGKYVLNAAALKSLK